LGSRAPGVVRSARAERALLRRYGCQPSESAAMSSSTRRASGGSRRSTWRAPSRVHAPSPASSSSNVSARGRASSASIASVAAWIAASGSPRRVASRSSSDTESGHQLGESAGLRRELTRRVRHLLQRALRRTGSLADVLGGLQDHLPSSLLLFGGREHLARLAVHVLDGRGDLPRADGLLAGGQAGLRGDALDVADRLLRLLSRADLLLGRERDLLHELPRAARGLDDLLERFARSVGELNAPLSPLRHLPRRPDRLA